VSYSNTLLLRSIHQGDPGLTDYVPGGIAIQAPVGQMPACCRRTIHFHTDLDHRHRFVLTEAVTVVFASATVSASFCGAGNDWAVQACVPTDGFCMSVLIQSIDAARARGLRSATQCSLVSRSARLARQLLARVAAPAIGWLL